MSTSTLKRDSFHLKRLASPISGYLEQNQLTFITIFVKILSSHLDVEIVEKIYSDPHYLHIQTLL